MIFKRTYSDFTLSYEVRGNELIEKVENVLDEIGNPKKYHDNYFRTSEDALIVSYDYGNEGIALTGLNVQPYLNDEEEVKLQIMVFSKVALHTEYDYVLDVDTFLSNPAKEEEILSCLYDNLTANKIKYKETIVNYTGMTDKEQEGIAFFITKGYRQGRINNLNWSIEINGEDTVSEIANMIEDGFTSGYYPGWKLSLNREYEDVDHFNLGLIEYLKDYLAENNIQMNADDFQHTLNGVNEWIYHTLSESCSDAITNIQNK